MSKWPMWGHFRYLRFKTFPMTPREPQCEVFWALLSSSKHSGVPKDSKSPTLEVLGFTSTLGQSGVATHGGTITSFNVYHKATKWFLHHMNGLVLFKRYTWSLDTLELSVLIVFSLLITIGKVCMLKSKTSLLGVNNVIEWEHFFFLSTTHAFSTPYSGHILSLVMLFN